MTSLTSRVSRGEAPSKQPLAIRSLQTNSSETDALAFPQASHSRFPADRQIGISLAKIPGRMLVTWQQRVITAP